MVVKFLDLKKQYLSIKEEIDSAIFRVIENSAFIGGDEVLRFEEEFSAFLGGGVRTLGVGNGTDALEIAIQSLNLPQGGEVLIPANTFVATAEAVVRNGLKVVFVDCGQDYTLDISDLESKITPACVAIVAVHLYGQSARMNEILKLAKNYGLKVIEDCAQSHGATYNGEKVGTFGDIGAFSFYPGKNLGAFGDGGMIVSRDSLLLRRCREIAHHGGLKKYEHNIVGRNSRLDSIQAAILRVKLRYLESWNARRREIAGLYLEALRGLPNIALPEVKESCVCVWHLFVIRSLKRQALREALQREGIEYGLHYPLSLPNTPAYSKVAFVRETACKNATLWQDEILSLPMGEHLENEEAQRVVEVLKDALCG
ncbi:DegT/DnrJ/EryC1/StrS family aminotransferase [Helicobacter mesocricetorum]|uniref:DegT/DnrJ/EryC1/StrS family aminotransferase n=1 Tax=Helicobacter mesocricetorum TaxID=87012 RepID=UPI000CF15B39|nr:DegT/DnrJ/EryC1/StrS family aminotransferase [Helicobacter mesocricetorum]